MQQQQQENQLEASPRAGRDGEEKQTRVCRSLVHIWLYL